MAVESKEEAEKDGTKSSETLLGDKVVKTKSAESEDAPKRRQAPVLQHQTSSTHKVQFANDDDASKILPRSFTNEFKRPRTISNSSSGTPERRRHGSSSSYALAQKNPRRIHRRTFSESSGKTDRSSVTSTPLSRTSSSTSSSSDDTSTTYSFTAPDGGWGWVIVVASFFINFIADGVTFSFGVLFLQLQEEFQEGKALTAAVVSLFHAIPLLSGPIASSLTDRWR